MPCRYDDVARLRIVIAYSNINNRNTTETKVSDRPYGAPRGQGIGEGGGAGLSIV